MWQARCPARLPARASRCARFCLATPSSWRSAGATVAHEHADLFGGPARLLAGTAAGLDLLALDAPHLYNRSGNSYLGPDGRDWPDNSIRFAALGRVCADIGLGLLPDFVPNVVH